MQALRVKIILAMMVIMVLAMTVSLVQADDSGQKKLHKLIKLQKSGKKLGFEERQWFEYLQGQKAVAKRQKAVQQVEAAIAKQAKQRIIKKMEKAVRLASKELIAAKQAIVEQREKATAAQQQADAYLAEAHRIAEKRFVAQRVVAELVKQAKKDVDLTEFEQLLVAQAAAKRTVAERTAEELAVLQKTAIEQAVVRRAATERKAAERAIEKLTSVKQTVLELAAERKKEKLAIAEQATKKAKAPAAVEKAAKWIAAKKAKVQAAAEEVAEWMTVKKAKTQAVVKEAELTTTKIEEQVAKELAAAKRAVEQAALEQAAAEREAERAVTERAAVKQAAAKQAERHVWKSYRGMIAKRLQVMSGNSSSRAGIGAGDTFSYGLWLQGVYTQTQQDPRRSKQGGVLPGFSANSNAMTLGWDRDITLTTGDDLVVGAAVTAGNTTIHSRGVKDTATLDSYALTIYGQWQHGQWLTDAILGLGINQHHNQRYVGTSTQPLIADYQSDYASVRLLEGYTMTRGAWSIKPLVGLDYTHVHTDQHQEKGAVSGLVTKATNEHTLEVGAGLAVQRAVTVAKGQLIPAAKVMAWYDVANQPVTVTSRSLAGASTWTVTEAQPPRTAWEADLNLSYVRNQSTLVAGYNRNQEAGFHSDHYYLQFKYYF